jgi:hypothetical protein
MLHTKDIVLAEIADCESQLEGLCVMSRRMNRPMTGGMFGFYPSESSFGAEDYSVFRFDRLSLENELMTLYAELNKMNHNNSKDSDTYSPDDVQKPSLWRRFFNF